MLDIPYAVSWLAYCFEEEDEKHTHCVIQVRDPVSKMDVIRDISPFLEIHCELDVACHWKHIESAIGYHLGFGDKPRCRNEGGLIVIVPDMFDCDDYIRKKVMHAPRGVIQNQSRNEYLLQTDTKTLVDNGSIPLEKIRIITDSKLLYGSLSEDIREELDTTLVNSWGLHINVDDEYKRRHHWIWSRSINRGKSTFLRKLVAKYRGIKKSALWEWWNIRQDCDIICLDAYRGGIKWTDMESICEGDYDFNVKRLDTIRLNNPPCVIICSNIPPEEVYAEDMLMFNGRFHTHNVDE